MAAGARLGTAYIKIEPDFSRFQEKVGAKLATALAPATQRAGRNIGKDLARGVDQGGLRSALQPLLRRFDRFGDEAGKSIAAKIGKGSKPAAGDMFGLSRAISEVEKRTRAAGKTSSKFSSDMFGVTRAAKSAGRDLRSVTTQLSDFHTRAGKVKGTATKLADGIRGLGSDFESVVRRLKVGAGDFSRFNGVMSRVNRDFAFFRNILRTLKFPAFGLAAQSLSALAAAAIATASALGPLSGALIALPASALAAAQAFGVLKLATAGVQNAVQAAFTLQARGGTQAVQTMRQQEDAAEQVADAERSLADAHRQVQRAQESLSEARKAARRELEDMRLAAEGAHDAEQQANLSLIQARRELAKTLRDPKATGLEIRFAEEAVDQARNDLKQTQVDAKRARQDYADAHKKGVEKLPQVIAAKESLADANRGVAAAERDLTKALRDQADAMKEQGAAANTLQEKLAMLPPAARTFAKFLIGLKPRLDALRQTAAKGLFPGATKGIKAALGNFKVFQGIIGGTASALGKLAAKAGRKLGSELWGKDLTRVGSLNTRIIERMGDAGLNLADSFRNILVSAIPFLDWLSESTEKLTGWVKQETEAGRASGRLSAFFEETRQVLETLAPIFKGTAGGLLNVGKAARPLGNEILDALGKAAEGWRKWTDSVKGQNTLREYFRDTKPAIFELGRLARDAGKAFFELGKQNGVANLLRLIRTSLVPALRDAAGGMTGLLSGFLKRFEQLRREGVPAFNALVQTLAEHAGEAGVKIAKALVNAFLNSDIWGKLAIGGWLFAKFGGGKAFESMGAKFGRKFAGAFLLAVLGTELAKQVKQIIEGEKLDAPNSEEFAKYLNEYFDIDTAKIVAPNRVKITTALGSLLFNSQTQKVIATSNEKLQGLVGKIPEEFIVKFDRMRHLKEVVRRNLQPLGPLAGRTGTDIKRSILPKLDELTEHGGKKAEAFATRVGGAFTRMTGVASTAMELLGDNMGEMLRALGGKPPKINLKKALNLLPEFKPLPGSTPGRQRGGGIPGLAATVPGHSTGDRHTLSLNGRPIAKVESREGIFVGNRNLMGALQQANAAIPRFQKGGVVKGKHGLTEPHLMGPDGGLRKLGQAAIHKVYEGAKYYLDKHKPKLGGIAMPGGGGSVMAQIARVLFANGANKIAAAGIIGNAYRESRLNPGSVGSGGGGLWGFTSGAISLAALQAAASRAGVPWTDVPFQTAFMLRHGGAGLLPRLNAASSAAEAARIFMEDWERPGVPALAEREAAARKALQMGYQRGGFIGYEASKGMRKGGLLRSAQTGIRNLWSGVGPSGLHSGIRNLAAYVMEKYPGLQVTSTTGGTHAEGSYHYKGQAVDIASGDYGLMNQAAGWIKSSGLYKALVEGIHNPNLSVKGGNLVAPSYWGSETWAAHANHIHLAVDHPWSKADLGETGGSGAGSEGKPKETIPGHYEGAKTGPLNFGPMPKNLEKVETQIKQLEKVKLPTYRKAKRKAEKNGKPETAQAIGKNIGAIEDRLKGLRALRTRLKLQKARKALKRRMKRALSRFEGYGQIIEGSKLAYEKAAQDAEQVVALEPLSPELPAKASDQEREAAEKLYAEHTFPDYVEGSERPAFMNVLGKVAAWRNDILRAERFGFGKGKPSVIDSETAWEAEDRKVRNRIKQIKDFTDAVRQRIAKFHHEHPKEALPDWLKKQIADRDQMRQELPVLQMRDGKLTELITKARELFYPGGDKRLVPPPTPLPGTGELEEQLKEVQGIHPWPEQHELLGAGELAPPRQAGRFGGVIFDLQGTIEELGLKIRQGLNGLGSGGGGGPEDSERTSLLEELLRQANQRELVGKVQKGASEGFAEMMQRMAAGLPAFHTGGMVQGPSNREVLARLRGGEGVFTEDQMAALAPAESAASGPPSIEALHIYPDGRVGMQWGGQHFDMEVKRVVRGMRGTGVRTPGGAR